MRGRHPSASHRCQVSPIVMSGSMVVALLIISTAAVINAQEFVVQTPFLRDGDSKANFSLAEAAVGPRCSTSSYGPGFCTSAAVCAPWFHVVTSSPEFKCQLPNGQDGYCCPENDPTLTRSPFIGVKDDIDIRAPAIDAFGAEEVKWAAGVAKQALENLDKQESEWTKKGLYVKHGSASSFHGAFFRSRNESDQQGRLAYANIVAARALVEKYKLSPLDAGWGLRQFSAKTTSLGQACPDEPPCPGSYYYRTIDGTCNNLRRPIWGKSDTPFGRLMPPVYEDGIWLPRQRSVTGTPLPSARKASAKMEPDIDNPLHGVTLYTMLWGQFIDHDLTLGVLFKTHDGKTVACCDAEGHPVKEVLNHPACFPIYVDDSDSFYGKYKVQCMNFVRGLPSSKDGCTFGFAQQINQLTHWIDGSMIYGSTAQEEIRLRGAGGKMRVTYVRGLNEPLLPQNRFGVEDECTEKDREQYCFLAGDPRSNEQIVLTIMHTIMIREHNRIVDELKALNPHWSDERLYQEARRIVIAEVEHITYNEWLPLVIGPRVMYEKNLTPLKRGYRYDYDGTVNPAATSEFVIAFRFGHTLLQGHYDLVDENYRVYGSIKLKSVFNNPVLLYKNGYLDGLARGLSYQKVQSFDNSFTEDVQHHLFAKGHPYGLDLVSLNVQRGRDHAIRPYNHYREFCGLKRATTFDDLLDLMKPSEVESLKKVYVHVDDIDLFIGGVCEQPAQGAIVGPTFQCIISEQFARAKKGDRYFYDLGNQPHSFTPHQLAEIRKVSLARIVCDNVQNLRRVQPLLFYEASNVNNIVPCDSYVIPRMDLANGWREIAGG